jgi:hypothetical protein
MFQSDENGVFAIVQASGLRRVFGFGVLLALGGLVIYTALVSPPSAAWFVFMIIFGSAMLWLAEKMRRSTLSVNELTDPEIRTSTGEVLARRDDTLAVDRGAFAFKPSTGFTLKLNT